MLPRPELPTTFVGYLGEVIPKDKISMVSGEILLPHWRSKSCVIESGGTVSCEDCPPGYGASEESPEYRCRRIPTDWENHFREPINPFLQDLKKRENPDWPDTAYPAYSEDPGGLPRQYDENGFIVSRPTNFTECPKGQAFFVDDPQAGCKPLTSASQPSTTTPTPVETKPPTTTIDPSQVLKYNPHKETVYMPGKFGASTDLSSSGEATNATDGSSEDASKKKSSWVPWAIGLAAVGAAIGVGVYYKNQS